MGEQRATNEILGRQQLNRALLQRQMLLERQVATETDVIEHLVGMQAQVPTNPYYALWSRIVDYRPEELSAMVADGRAVRAPLMRTTLHLITAADCLTLYPLMLPVLARTLKNTPFGKSTQDMDYSLLLDRARELLKQEPKTLKQLGPLLQERWPDHNPSHLANVVHYMLPMLQVPPRGTWGASHQATWATVEDWLGKLLDPEPSVEEVILRYLAAFGPATSSDIRTWSGLTGLRESVARLKPELRTWRDERGRELLDLPDAPLPDPETPAPPRFLPEFDNILLSHADRTRIISDDDRKRLMTPNAVLPGTFLLDGYVHGTWRIERTRTSARLLLQPFRPTPPEHNASLLDEAGALLRFAAGDVTDHDVVIVDAD